MSAARIGSETRHCLLNGRVELCTNNVTVATFLIYRRCIFLQSICVWGRLHKTVGVFIVQPSSLPPLPPVTTFPLPPWTALSLRPRAWKLISWGPNWRPCLHPPRSFIPLGSSSVSSSSPPSCRNNKNPLLLGHFLFCCRFPSCQYSAMSRPRPSTFALWPGLKLHQESIWTHAAFEVGL